MADNGICFSGNKFCSNIGCQFRLAGFIFNKELDFFTQNAAFGVDSFGNEFGSLHSRQTVGSQITRVGAGNTDFNRVGGLYD